IVGIEWIEGGPSVALAHVGAEEADEMVDAEGVVDLRVAAGPRRQPLEAAGRDLAPAVGRQTPVLTGFGEGVRRRADRRVHPEIVLARPDVGAVAANHEREVAED